MSEEISRGLVHLQNLVILYVVFLCLETVIRKRFTYHTAVKSKNMLLIIGKMYSTPQLHV